MKRFFAVAAFIAALIAPPCAQAQNTLTISNTQQVDPNGRPLANCLLYLFISNTTAPANIFQDAGLSLVAPNPLVCDQNGRIPPFYFSGGTIHARLTDSGGVVQFDLPAALGIGNSGGGGGGGGVDPTTVASTGDLKFRLSGESLTGWVRLNAQTVGSASSGATGRANADTQTLFVYLWNLCPDVHCTVSSGRGATGLADFQANKTITLPDCRGRACMLGLDGMGNAVAGRISAGNLATSLPGDGADVPFTTGGENNHTITQAQLPAVTPTFTGNPTTPTFTGNARAWPLTGTPQTWTLNQQAITTNPTAGTQAGANFSSNNSNVTNMTVNVTPAGSTTVTPDGSVSAITPSGNISSFGSGASMNVMPSFSLGTYYMKL